VDEVIYRGTYFLSGENFQAEPDTDEVFAQVTLLPEPNVS